MSLTEKEKLILRVLRWKLDFAGVSGAAVDGLKRVTDELNVSWYKCKAVASRLAPDIRVDEYPCCPDSHAAYTTVSPQPTTLAECAEATCPHCGKAYFRGLRPLKIYPVFPLAPRLVRQWLCAQRAKLLRYRHKCGISDPSAPGFIYKDYVDGERYRTSPATRYPDEYTHALALSLDGFQIFKQCVRLLVASIDLILTTSFKRESRLLGHYRCRSEPSARGAIQERERPSPWHHPRAPCSTGNRLILVPDRKRACQALRWYVLPTSIVAKANIYVYRRCSCKRREPRRAGMHPSSLAALRVWRYPCSRQSWPYGVVRRLLRL